MRTKFLVIGLVVFGLVVGSFSCVAPKPVPTTPVEVSFEGKTIILVCPYPPGGGTDIVVRVWVRYLPQYLPGKPAMIVRNIPGGASTIGANYAYLAKPDGLTVMGTGGSVALAQLVGSKAARYDLLKMTVLIGTPIGGMVFMKTGIIDKPDDILKAKGVIYGSTAGLSSYVFICSKELLNIPTEKVIAAYAGGGDSRRAFLIGEINMTYDGTSAYIEAIVPYVQKGEVMPVFQTGLFDDKGNMIKEPIVPPEIPTCKELYEKLYGKPPSGIAWEAYKAVIAGGLNYSKLLLLPPGTPDSIVRVYWDACEKMIKDPEFRKVAEPLAGECARWMVGEAADKGFKLNFRLDPKVVEWLRAILPKYGMVVE